jgi:hypothetical protein
MPGGSPSPISPPIRRIVLAVAMILLQTPARAADFVRDIQPLLAARCVECHQGDKPKGGLRLDAKSPALAGGESGPVIVPGKSAASDLITRITSADKDQRMPPKGERLTAAQIALLRDWIDAGALWPDGVDQPAATKVPHWSLRPLIKPALPTTKGNPIDAFIDAKLSEHELTRSPQADPRSLIRRVTFGLTGLPPTPEEVDAFVKACEAFAAAAQQPARALPDGASTSSASPPAPPTPHPTPDPYAALVTRLLASPRHGEHWARHWLDVVHYADTHGNDHDFYRPNAWPYRDYVISAFNSDKPYARFVAEQVAGDVLFPDDPQATVALGFLAAGPWDHTLMSTIREDTVDHRMGQNLDRDNMVATVMSAFQSLTVHCARCHNHKFDPITQREYYGLQAVFAGVDRADRPFDTDAATLARRKALTAEKTAIAARDPALLASLDSPAMLDKVAAATEDYARRGQRWQPLELINVASSSASEGTVFSREADGSWFVSGQRPEKDTFILTAQTTLKAIRALRLEVLPDKRLPQGGPGRYDNGNFHLAQFRATMRPAKGQSGDATKLAFTAALADHADAGDTVAGTIDKDPNTYWSIHPRYNEPHEAVFELKDPAGDGELVTLTIYLDFTGKSGHQIGRFRLGASTQPAPASQLAPPPPALAALLGIPGKDRTAQQRRDLVLALLGAEVERELAALPRPKFVYAATKDFTASGSFRPALKPRPIHLLSRGDINKPGDVVGPGALACIPNLPASLDIANLEDESLRRAALARWLTDDRNALTWRSIVNRVWHYHFGRGLCDTPNDFGLMGGAPSHPELLDWLAVWFRDDAKGSLKKLHELIVTSETYRQASRVGSPESSVRSSESKGRDEGTEAQRHEGASKGIRPGPTPDTLNAKPHTLRSDSDNRLLSRMNRTRLTGEMVRDAALAMSGRLDSRLGGPAEVQFNHKGIDRTFLPADGSPPFLDYEHFDPDAPENRRRAVYRFVFRTVPDPLMDALDCPDGGAMTPVRSVSTTAVQALAMLNNTLLIRQCEHIAARLAKEAPTADAQAAAAFRLMLQRPPRESERAAFITYIQRHGLANACHVLLCTNEFLYID